MCAAPDCLSKYTTVLNEILSINIDFLPDFQQRVQKVKMSKLGSKPRRERESKASVRTNSRN